MQQTQITAYLCAANICTPTVRNTAKYEKYNFQPKELGHRIKMARDAKRISQDKLATEVDLSVRTMSSVEDGSSNVSVVNLFRIAEVLEEPMEKLLNLGELAISNSFNNIHEKASVQGMNNTRVEADREWIQDVHSRFVFLEQLVLSLREENAAVREELRAAKA